MKLPIISAILFSLVSNSANAVEFRFSNSSEFCKGKGETIHLLERTPPTSLVKSRWRNPTPGRERTVDIMNSAGSIVYGIKVQKYIENPYNEGAWICLYPLPASSER